MQGDPNGLILDHLVASFAEKKIQLAAVKITEQTNKMHEIMNEVYQKKCGKPILFSELGSSTKNFNFFLTQSISQTLSLSSLGNANSKSLINNLLQI